MNNAATPKLRQLTRKRMILAVVIAVLADIVQFGASFFGGWAFFDEGVDVVVMLIMMRLLGFHWMLLPTFLVEFVPFVDMLPTWTACVLWVVRLRHKQQKQLAVATAPPVMNQHVG